MSHDALGEQFAQHIADFRDRFHERGWHDEDHALGECMDATWAFNHHLANAGVEHAKHVELMAPMTEAHYDADPGDDDDITNDYVNHSVTQVPHPQTGVPHIVDWTARQFQPDADYPTVMPRDKYKQKFSMQDDRHGWANGSPYDSPGMKRVLVHDEYSDHWQRPKR